LRLVGQFKSSVSMNDSESIHVNIRRESNVARFELTTRRLTSDV